MEHIYDPPLYGFVFDECNNYVKKQTTLLDCWKDAIIKRDIKKTRLYAEQLAYVDFLVSHLFDLLAGQSRALLGKMYQQADLEQICRDFSVENEDCLRGYLRKNLKAIREPYEKNTLREADLLSLIIKTFPDEVDVVPNFFLDKIDSVDAAKKEAKRLSKHIKESVNPDSGKSYQ